MLFNDQYAYLLGQYLGDGSIVGTRRGVFRLEIACTATYPSVTAECGTAVAYVLGRVPSTRSRPGVSLVTAYSKHWPCVFPQHGPGRKHERRLRLWLWQRELVERNPEAFVRGLLHSDGCRYVNRVTVRGKRYQYPSYDFSNASADIHDLFRWACDLTGVAWRRRGERGTAVTTRAAVEQLDAFVGPKA